MRPMNGHPAKIEIEKHQLPKERNRAPRRRESIDTLTPALDDDCIIAR